MRFYKVIVQTVLAPIVGSSLYLLVFGVSLGRQIKMADISYLGFLVPGLVMMGVLNNAFQNASSSIISSKFSGDLEDYKVSPLTYQQIIWALALGGLFRGLIVGTVTFCIGQLFYWGMHHQFLGVAHPFLLILFLIIGGLSFAMIGLSVAIRVKSVDQLGAFGNFILVPLIYLGGVFFSIKTLHPFWEHLSHFNPVLYFINGVRYGILGTTDVSIPLALGIAVLTIVSVNVFSLYSLRNSSFSRW
ncbi:MAG: ABC transporter permease [Bdellovibrio sp.]|nr:MAG: ABC transporter permease [Bdellovibrio sp.]